MPKTEKMKRMRQRIEKKKWNFHYPILSYPIKCLTINFVILVVVGPLA